jgi:hypothetical protein
VPGNKYTREWMGNADFFSRHVRAQLNSCAIAQHRPFLHYCRLARDAIAFAFSSPHPHPILPHSPPSSPPFSSGAACRPRPLRRSHEQDHGRLQRYQQRDYGVQGTVEDGAGGRGACRCALVASTASTALSSPPYPHLLTVSPHL